MKTFVILSPEAADSTGFKNAVTETPIGYADDLPEARTIAHTAGGGAIFITKDPIGNPITNGGKQPWGDPLNSISLLEWKCLVEVIVPGTLKSKSLDLK